MIHSPVMVGEIVAIFADVPGGVVIDATYGLGGHTKALREKYGAKFRYLGIDRDGEILKVAKKDLTESVELKKMNLSDIPSMVKSENISPIVGAIFDLGLSSAHLDDPSRGFSYLQDAPLDLRFDRSSGKPASETISALDESKLTRILKEYGQEKHARAISRSMARNKPRTTGALADLIRAVTGPRGFNKAAARVFQALRIYVNDELDAVKSGISGIIPVLAVGGRIAVISYHSLEDGIVKRIFSLKSGKCFCGPGAVECECGSAKLLKVLTKKPRRPSPEQIEINPRARSARLRCAEKI